MNRAVFLDKDGTLIEDQHYAAGTPVFMPGVIDNLRRIQDEGYLLIVVTNQSGIAKGMFSAGDLDRQRSEMDVILSKHGVSLDGWYACHHEGGCSCRKPEPGMMIQAAHDHAIDLTRSWMVGDKESDLEAGRRAGCMVTSQLSEVAV